MAGKLVYGVGINDAGYVVRWMEEGVQVRCPFYKKWCDMLYRCYSKPYLSKNPTYQNITVCEEWLTFSKFKAWMEKQEWQGKVLDKDILGRQNTQYRPERCAFISSRLNGVFTSMSVQKTELPLGVTPVKKSKHERYQSRGRSFDGTRLHLGYCSTPEEAHLLWQKSKVELLKHLVESETDIGVIEAVKAVIKTLEFDIETGRITKNLK